tara:strand:- start:3269 stop:3856 length:588 start_codon:yes stop_codon:yes gene_type:complete
MTSRDSAQNLLTLDLDARIDAVAADVESRADEYPNIPEFELAELLGISDVRTPGGWPTWERVTYCIKCSLEEWAEILGAPSCLVDFIPESIDPARRELLEAELEGLDEGDGPVFGFLDPVERAAIETAVLEDEMRNIQDNGMNCLAHTHVKSKSGATLSFEADIEDDGKCETLRTPYDKRDGLWVDLSNCELSEG